MVSLCHPMHSLPPILSRPHIKTRSRYRSSEAQEIRTRFKTINQRGGIRSFFRAVRPSNHPFFKYANHISFICLPTMHRHPPLPNLPPPISRVTKKNVKPCITKNGDTEITLALRTVTATLTSTKLKRAPPSVNATFTYAQRGWRSSPEKNAGPHLQSRPRRRSRRASRRRRRCPRPPGPPAPSARRRSVPGRAGR